MVEQGGYVRKPYKKYLILKLITSITTFKKSYKPKQKKKVKSIRLITGISLFSVDITVPDWSMKKYAPSTPYNWKNKTIIITHFINIAIYK